MMEQNPKIKNTRYIELGKKLAKNISDFLKREDLNNAELAKLANMPHSTVYGMSSGVAVNPRLATLVDIANFFEVNISQLIGELPLNLKETVIPIISWQNLDATTGTVNIDISEDTKFLSCYTYSSRPMFAMYTDLNLTELFSQNNIIIVEETDVIANNNLVILSMHTSEPVIKKVLKEGPDTYLESLATNIPIQKLNQNSTKVFGVIREIRKVL